MRKLLVSLLLLPLTTSLAPAQSPQKIFEVPSGTEQVSANPSLRLATTNRDQHQISLWYNGKVLQNLLADQPGPSGETLKFDYQIQSHFVGHGPKYAVLFSENSYTPYDRVFVQSPQKQKVLELRGGPNLGIGTAYQIALDHYYRPYIYDPQKGRLYAYTADGDYRRAIPLKQKVTHPKDFRIDSEHNFYLLDDRDKLLIFSSEGEAKVSMQGIYAFYLTSQDQLVCIDEKNRMQHFASRGEEIESIPFPSSQFGTPLAVSINEKGHTQVLSQKGGTSYFTRYDYRGELLEEQKIPGLKETPKATLMNFQGDLFQIHSDLRQGSWFYDFDTEQNRCLSYQKGALSSSPSATTIDNTPKQPELAVWSNKSLWVSQQYKLFHYLSGSGWQTPRGVGIRGVTPRAEILSMTGNSKGNLAMVLTPLGRPGELYLQIRNPKAQLLFQKKLASGKGPFQAMLGLSSDQQTLVHFASQNFQDLQLRKPTTLILDSKGETKKKVHSTNKRNIGNHFLNKVKPISTANVGYHGGQWYFVHDQKLTLFDSELNLQKSVDINSAQGDKFVSTSFSQGWLFLLDQAGSVYKRKVW